MNAYAIRVIINIYIPMAIGANETMERKRTQPRKQFNNIKPQYQQNPEWD